MGMTFELWDPSDAPRSKVLLEWAGSGDTPEELALVREATHHNLLRTLSLTPGVRQAGPVEWRTYAPEAAADMLAEAGAGDHPAAAGLLAFLRDVPGTVLVVASVPAVPS